ncbi:MAG: hypothetical protein VKK63_00225 [Synechococcus sp.]|nr:hypothetical protein [Synechococcus sp.]
MIKIDITTNAKDVASGMQKFPKAMAEAIAGAMNQQNTLLVGYIQRNKLTTRGANSVGVVSGQLRGSVYASVASASESEVTSEVGSPIFYAIYQEEGTRPYTIVPRKARVLSWVGQDGNRAFAKKVKHPGLKARHMFRTAIEERSQDYQDALLAAADEAWENVWSGI